MSPPRPFLTPCIGDFIILRWEPLKGIKSFNNNQSPPLNTLAQKQSYNGHRWSMFLSSVRCIAPFYIIPNAWGDGNEATWKSLRIAHALSLLRGRYLLVGTIVFMWKFLWTKTPGLISTYRRAKNKNGQVMFCFQFPRAFHWKETLTVCQG